MSNSYRNGAFALGLVVGGGLALNLFLWLDYQAKRECHNSAEKCQTGENYQIGTLWDGMFGTFVSRSDTLAQWIMAFVTIAATILLLLTLRSANETNIAALRAANAALEANQIMQDQSAGYLIIEKVEIQTRANEVFAYATVKNIGQRPVRSGKIEGKIKFVCWLSSQDGIPQFKFYRVKTEIFVGVVEAGQKSRGLSMIPWNDIANDPNIYKIQIFENESTGIDFDCRISWSERLSVSNNERHILTSLADIDVLEAQNGRITELNVTYSGNSRIREEMQNKQMDK
ncbi:hypothetical protein [Ascidiaceihabitans sp.]|uniref:hypothetical protein n=1 Tax=Ascidiaceihabitans sp. TaxID=1872644 RepID=UPI0032977A7E